MAMGGGVSWMIEGVQGNYGGLIDILPQRLPTLRRAADDRDENPAHPKVLPRTAIT